MGTSPNRKAGKLRTQVKNIPSELRKLPQWVCAAKDGAPINPRTGTYAKSNDPNTWGTIEYAAEACEKYGHSHVALALTSSDPYAIVDLDDKADKPADEATLDMFAEIIEQLDSYTERSRSGRGAHVVVKAELGAPLKTPHVEVYADAHFMTFTGDVQGKPKKIAERSTQVASIADKLRPKKQKKGKGIATQNAEEPDNVVLQRASESISSGERFQALHGGDITGYPSRSEADFAYMGMLWDASGNVVQVERLFRESAIFRKEKEHTITKALEKISQSPPRMLLDDGPASMLSDTANAHRLVRHFGDSLLFAPGVGWHAYDGARWKHDSLEARRLTSKLGRRILGEAGAMMQHAATVTNREESDRAQELAEKLFKFAGQAENVNKIEAALKAAEPLLRIDPDALDADPWLLGCPNGAVNLRVGKLVPSESSLFITKSTGIEFDSAAEAPTWSKFLQRIFRGNPDLIPFMQQLAGYWLTGLTDPPFLSVLYGVGANGKSTLVSALTYAMGEYAMAAPPGLLMSKYGERHPTELAALQGKRFVVAAETSEGGRLDEERIKALTGSDPITARRMREDFYTFAPSHSFALMTNHKPIVRGVDEGIWRRLLLVPFNEVIPDEERDTGLTEKLRAEAPGILLWAVEGARLFHKNDCKLKLPKVVAEATKEYRTESDVLGEFLSDECEQGKLHTVAASVLYLRYVEWCAENGERAMSKKALGLRLQGDGYKPAKDRRGNRSWQGLRLRGAGSIKGQA